MRYGIGIVITLSMVVGVLAWAADAPRPAEAILADYDGAKLPPVDSTKMRDQDYVRSFMTQRMQVMEKKAEFALELYRGYPEHARIPEVMRVRWSTLGSVGSPDTLIAETKTIAEGSSPLAKDAAYVLAQARCVKAKWSYEPCLAAIEAFEAKVPGDERGAALLSMVAQRIEGEQAVALYRRLAEKYPNSRMADSAKGKLRQAEGIGKPFELSFKEATSGKEIDLKDLKGKVLVIDFWATWCGPCIAEMPKMKQLYAQYKDKGVEFIGVSLDQPEDRGGLTKLKEYVAKNEIAWPQYYQGNYWDSEFSKSWGINAIPCVFVVDQQGNLYSTSARGKLETMIPELLERK